MAVQLPRLLPSSCRRAPRGCYGDSSLARPASAGARPGGRFHAIAVRAGGAHLAARCPCTEAPGRGSVRLPDFVDPAAPRSSPEISASIRSSAASVPASRRGSGRPGDPCRCASATARSRPAGHQHLPDQIVLRAEHVVWSMVSHSEKDGGDVGCIGMRLSVGRRLIRGLGWVRVGCC
jgi:hypothetical protein